jgi:hypothetical protein
MTLQPSVWNSASDAFWAAEVGESHVSRMPTRTLRGLDEVGQIEIAENTVWLTVLVTSRSIVGLIRVRGNSERVIV